MHIENNIHQLGMEAHNSNSTTEGGWGKASQVQGQPVLHSLKEQQNSL